MARRRKYGRDYYVCRTSPPYGYGKRKGIAVSKTIDGLPAYCLHPIRRRRRRLNGSMKRYAAAGSGTCPGSGSTLVAGSTPGTRLGGARWRSTI